MKNILFKLLLFFCLLFTTTYSFARDVEGVIRNQKKLSNKQTKDISERCRRATSSAQIDINNVRCRINATGNVWVSGLKPYYYVPANSNSTSLYCGALWIGGHDENSQLRVAALRFGSVGDDFWPGPLTADGTATTNAESCNKWDKHYKITRAEVESFVAASKAGDFSKATEVIRNWPAHGDYENAMQSKYIAPFFDVDGDGKYDWQKGDYPYYDFTNSLCPRTVKATLPAGSVYIPRPTLEDSLGTGHKSIYGGILVDQVLKGDQTIFWVFNDNGNAHTESKSDNAIGLEIRAQAFAFSTNDEINNMTFYSYEIINRSTYTIQETFFSQWVDADLGAPNDDYVGCDVKRGLGYCYNGKSIDGPHENAYIGNPPAVGIDFFQGPYMDPDGKDNPKIDIAKMEKLYPTQLTQYELKDVNGRPLTNGAGKILYDTVRLTDDAELYYNHENGGAWYFEPDDFVGNCAINGVNFGNGIVDDERFGMRRFVYHNNDARDKRLGDPEKASDYYNFLRGIWKDNARMVFGGNGYPAAGNNSYWDTKKKVECDFMFPANTDPWFWGTNGISTKDFGDTRGWTEESSNNNYGDRRFMQSAGPFTLKPGAVNYITVGIPWAQATSGGPYASVELLRQVDDKCQALFDNCFTLLDGPDAPNLIVQELSNKVILYLDNPAGSNNEREKYSQLDIRIPKGENTLPTDSVIYRNTNPPHDTNVVYKYDTMNIVYDRFYKFEGYQIFQLKDETVSVSELQDLEKARLVAQCDIQNYADAGKSSPIGALVNYEKDNNIGALVPRQMVNGLNQGIQHSFEITEDKFATGTNTQLVNNKKYYYIAIAYAYNNYKKYDPTSTEFINGQKQMYLAGRKNASGASVKAILAMPHDLLSVNGGTVIQAPYGTSPEITRLEGRGNGGIILELTEESEKAILESIPYGDFGRPQYVPEPVYKKNASPLNIKVIDPLSLKQGEYLVAFTGIENTDKWSIRRKDNAPVLPGQQVIYADTTINIPYEQLFLDLGISIKIEKVSDVATTDTILSERVYGGGNAIPGALLSATMTFEDNTKPWLTGVHDNDGIADYNWIRSGGIFESQLVYNQYGGAICSPADSLTHVQQDYYYETSNGLANLDPKSYDSDQQFEKVLGGTWAPYRLTSNTSEHPAFSAYYYYSSPNYSSSAMRGLADWRTDNALLFNRLVNVSSVDIVFTSDKSKWTRCPVIEMSNDHNSSFGGAKRFQLRKSPSVNQDGKPMNNEKYPIGMGWFPGYAINIETGERLNMIFGEDSREVQSNGRDMLWNPVTAEKDRFGAKHYIYIIGNNSISYLRNDNIVTSRPYDAGDWAYTMLASLNDAAVEPNIAQTSHPLLEKAYQVFANVMWVGMPIVTDSRFLFSNPADIPTKATVKIRVRKAYKKNFTGNDIAPTQVVNDNNPMYKFGISTDMIPLINQGISDKNFSDKMLDQISAVPNPYYGGNGYEGNKLDKKVRITNLPANSIITIYAPDGTMVRRLGPSPAKESTLDWDLNNHVGIPIAGGVYLIHVKAPGIGETVIRWFGAMRPVDLNTYQF